MNKLNHIGIILDGNGRWAKERGLSRSMGHLEGSKNIERLILHISRKYVDIKCLSLYVFSIDNFKRDSDEVNYLMELFLKTFKRVKKTYEKENIRIVFSGDMSLLNEDIKKSISDLTYSTSKNTGLMVNFCLSYQGRYEIVEACKKICTLALNKKISINDINEKLVNSNMYNDLPDIDLLIRTSGEQRISGFMLWQISYAEFFFTKTYFPAFSTDEFDDIIYMYNNRDRRFGTVKDK